MRPAKGGSSGSAVRAKCGELSPGGASAGGGEEVGSGEAVGAEGDEADWQPGRQRRRLKRSRKESLRKKIPPRSERSITRDTALDGANRSLFPRQASIRRRKEAVGDEKRENANGMQLFLEK